MATNPSHDDPTAALLKAAEKLVLAARKAGATASDASVRQSRSFGVGVRNGKVESTSNSEDEGLSLRVFVDGRVASVSGPATADPDALAERAVAMARVSPVDPQQGLADPDRLATDWPDLDLHDATEPGAERFTEMALAAEAAGLAHAGISGSVGASAGSGAGGLVLVTSGGFSGAFLRSSFSVSVSLLAGTGTGMERDYDFSSRVHFADLDDPASVGERAAERTVKRLGAVKPKTGRMPVVFAPRVARGLAGHLSAAVNGAAVARKSTFLRNRMGERILPEGIDVTDNPLLPRRMASRPFDGEGVRGEPLTIIEDGVLATWLLSSSAARELGLETNGRGVRSGSSVSPSSTNFGFRPGTVSPETLIGEIAEGLYITEVFGQGVDIVSGKYSRGASGFMIRNGALAEPVSEFTIASELPDMFRRLTLADDVDPDFSMLAPTLRIDGMMVAGA